jgi:hypothetical protein
VGVAAAQRRLRKVLHRAQRIAGELRDLAADLEAPGPPAEHRRGAPEARLRSFLRAMVAQMLADEVEPLLAALGRAATIEAEEVPDDYPLA